MVNRTSRREFLTSSLAALTFMAIAPGVKAEEQPNFQQISNIVYKKVGEREITLNLFLPLQDGKPLQGEPLLIHMDSGCWYSGDPGDAFVWKALDALGRGFALASVSHRSIDEAPMPAPMEDVRAAVRFLRKHAAEYGYDPERFAVTGCSSGGHLSLTLGISDELCQFNVGDDLDVSGQVQRVVDFFGPTDLADLIERHEDALIDCAYDSFAMPREAGKKDSPLHAELLKRAKKCSPIEYVDSNFAPTLILQGTNDELVPLSQSAFMYEKLRLAGVRAQLIVADGGIHDPTSLGSLDMTKREVFEFLQW